MFTGSHNHTMDEKGRIKMPAKYREELGSRFVVTRGHDKCLYIYTSAEWEKVSAKVANLPKNDENARKYSRIFFSGMDIVDMDAQGRFPVSQMLREYAGLKKDVVVVGNSNTLEIWDKDRWDEYNIDVDDLGDLDMSAFDI